MKKYDILKTNRLNFLIGQNTVKCNTLMRPIYLMSAYAILIFYHCHPIRKGQWIDKALFFAAKSSKYLYASIYYHYFFYPKVKSKSRDKNSKD